MFLGNTLCEYNLVKIILVKRIFVDLGMFFSALFEFLSFPGALRLGRHLFAYSTMPGVV